MTKSDGDPNNGSAVGQTATERHVVAVDGAPTFLCALSKNYSSGATISTRCWSTRR